MLSRRHVALAVGLAVAVSVVLPGVAPAAGVGRLVVGGSVLGSLGGLAGGVFSGIGHAVLGAFSWTVGLASKFILTTLAALVHLLIPHSWITKGLEIMRWLVAVPDYAGQITTPGGGHAYGFAGINALRDVFTWLGIAAAPLSLIYATSRALIGDGDPIGIPVLRMLATALVVISYPYWWSQVAALADQVTNAILSVPAVTAGLQRLMAYAVGGVALGGWQLIDLGLMGATGLALLALIFLKVVVILLGALLYATGPVMIGLVPTRAGSGLARAWASAAIMLLGLGVVWASVFAVGAVLIGDSSTAGPLIAGNNSFGRLVGGLLLAVAGVASLWVCLKVAKEASGLLRMQLAGLLALGTNHGSAGSSHTAPAVARTTGSSLRSYGSRLAGAAHAAGTELELAGAAGAGVATAGRAAGFVGRRGLLGTAGAGVGVMAVKGAPAAVRVMERSRAGALAARMARAGTASWTSNTPKSEQPPQPGSAGHDGRRHDGRSPRNDTPTTPDPTVKSPDRAATATRPAVPVAGASTAPRTRRTDDSSTSRRIADSPPRHAAKADADPTSAPSPPTRAPDNHPAEIDREAAPRRETMTRDTTPPPGPAGHRGKRSPRPGGER